MLRNSAHGQEPVILRPNIYSVIEMIFFWCGLPLAVEAFLLGYMISDKLNRVATDSNLISAFWLILVPLGVAAYITATWAFSTVILDRDHVTLRIARNSETVPAAEVATIKHREVRGGIRHALFVTDCGSLWINKSAYSLVQIQVIIDYVKARSRYPL